MRVGSTANAGFEFKNLVVNAGYHIVTSAIVPSIGSKIFKLGLLRAIGCLNLANSVPKIVDTKVIISFGKLTIYIDNLINRILTIIHSHWSFS